MADRKPVRRARKRKASLNIDRTAIFKRIETFYNDDKTARDIDLNQRLERYAKYRCWTSGEGGPWEGSSDVAMSDMMEKSLRMQDTLHNAVMSQRPPITSEAVSKQNQAKEDAVNSILDYQFFEEANGENIIGDLADAFVNDGVITIFVPWVREKRRTSRTEIFPPIPADMYPPDYFTGVLRQIFGERLMMTPTGADAWDYKLELPMIDDDGKQTTDKTTAHFYTLDDNRVEMVMKGELKVFDAPLPMVLDYDDVFHPPQCANLQPPGPSNPKGAAHVILRDFPTKDEIASLQKSGYYDLMTADDLKALKGYSRPAGGDDDAEETQRDDLGGKTIVLGTQPEAQSHDTVTRLLCFDRWDIDGDGLDEDVIWWVLLEPKMVVRARVLQEVYPSMKPQRPRPLAEASLFPVRGRRVGISLLEMLEGLHDAMKVLLDQTIDANTIGIVPFWFYRPTSTMQSERIRLAPGEGFPLGDPARDIAFPQIGNPQAQGMAINLFTLLQQAEERVSVVGDFQLGRVPAGKATALRTTGGMQLLAGQGEARPERILRRFFGCLANVFSIMHDLNGYFLSKPKQIRIQGTVKPNDDPYQVVEPSQIRGEFRFKFRANAMNTAKQQLQQTLQTLLGTYVNALAMQLGITNPETTYNLLRDFGKALGVDPENSRYLNPPTPTSGGIRILAQEAMAMLLMNQQPMGEPAEAGGWMEHLQSFQALMEELKSEEIDTGEISPQQGQAILAYAQMAAQRAAQEQQRAQQLAAAQAFAQQQGAAGGQQQGGRPPEQAPPNPNVNPQVSGGGELLDESLPGAKGGVQ